MDQQSAHFIYEVGLLARIQRSGLAYLGSGEQSIAEHAFRVAHVALLLAHSQLEVVDEGKLLRLCLFHDVPEVRTGDHNYVNRRYVMENLAQVLDDLEQHTPYGSEIKAWITEFEEGDSLEARLARDADQLELLAFLKEQVDAGHPVASRWMAGCRRRIDTEVGQQLAEHLVQGRFDDWWQNRWEPDAKDFRA